ncbi:hypothetical protein GGI35DRAFT_486356 [Trichoderma velutinum]
MAAVETETYPEREVLNMANGRSQDTGRSDEVRDGLDECESKSRQELFSLFKDLHAANAPVKVFISSRHDNNIKKLLVKDFSQVEVPFSRENDFIIAKRLADEIRGTVVARLSEKANGCAIWTRIALDYLNKRKIASPEALEDALQDLPSYKDLGELYLKLFLKACSDIPQNKKLVRRALEMLAIAQRPLSPEELAYAVFIDTSDESSMTIARLEKMAKSVKLREFIQPFISVEDGEYGRFRLVHQSLKEVILETDISYWETVKPKEASIHMQHWIAQPIKRKEDLNGNLLKCCIKYLLLRECEDVDLSSEFELIEHLGGFGGTDDENMNE